MSKLSVTLGADTSKFVHEVDSARHMLNKFIEESKKVAETSRENVSASDEQIQAYSRVISQLEKVASGTLTTAQQEKALAEQIKELNVQWQNLSEEVKQGDFGKSISDTMSSAKAELDDLKQKLANVGDVKMGANLKKELRNTTNQLVQMTAKYREMTQAEQQSAEGQALLKKMDQLRIKAADLTDTIGDVNAEIKSMASDTSNLDAFNDLVDVGGSALQAYSGIMSKVTGNEIDLRNAISTVIAVQSTVNTLTKIGNMLQSSSVVMLKVRKIQEAAAAAAIRIKTSAELKSTVATKGATIAQAAFNAVANANPYVLLATALLAVGSALIGFTRNAKEATDEMKDLNDEAGKGFVDNLGQEYADSYGSIAGRIASSMSTLLLEWKELKDDFEKTEWIKKNQSALKQLGLSIENVSDATNAFDVHREELSQYLDELAAFNAKKEIYEKTMAERVKVDTRFIDPEQFRTAKAGDSIVGKSLPENMSSLTESKDYIKIPDTTTGKNNIYTLTESGAKKYNDILVEEGLAKAQEEQQKELEKIDKSLNKQYSDYQDAFRKVREEEKKIKDLGIKTGDSPVDAKEVDYAAGSLSDLENKLSDLQKKYKDGVLNITPEQYQSQVKDLEEQIKRKKIALGLEIDFNAEDIEDIQDMLQNESLTKLNNRLSELKTKYEDGLIQITPEDYQRKLRILEKAIKEKRIALGLDPVIDERSLKGIEDKISEKENELKLAVDDESRYKIQREIDALTREKKDIEFRFTVDEEELKRVGETVGETIARYRQHAVDQNDLKRSLNMDPVGGAGKARKGGKLDRDATIVRDELDFQREITNTLRDQYKLILQKQQAGVALTQDENTLAGIYEQAEDSLAGLEYRYKQLTKAAEGYQSKAQLNAHLWSGWKGEISAMGSLASAVDDLADRYSKWDEVLKDENKTSFEKSMYVITTYIATLEHLVNAVDTVVNTLKWFNEMNDLVTAKRLANNQAEITSDAIVTASEKANTAARIANNEQEMASDVATIGVKEGVAIAGATASGSVMPFPYNLVAIAAGLATVAGAFIMAKKAGAFANGGIVSGGSGSGDTQFARVNSGEMILNGTQQKRLFNLLDGTASRTGNVVGQGGEVVFKIKGNTLYGVLDNYMSKNRKI